MNYDYLKANATNQTHVRFCWSCSAVYRWLRPTPSGIPTWWCPPQQPRPWLLPMQPMHPAASTINNNTIICLNYTIPCISCLFIRCHQSLQVPILIPIEFDIYVEQNFKRFYLLNCNWLAQTNVITSKTQKNSINTHLLSQ